MKKVLLLICVMIFAATIAHAAGPKTYLVTGSIVEMKGDSFVVQKDNDKWEMTRDATTKVNGDLKVGAKVTVVYKMSATMIAVTKDNKPETKK